MTKVGREQAQATAGRLKEQLKDCTIDSILVSPLTRARETADIIKTQFPDVPLKIIEGAAEGVPILPSPACRSVPLTKDDVDKDSPRINAAFEELFFRPPPIAANTPLLDRGEEDDHTTTIVVVCHGNVIRYWLCRALQFPTKGWLRMAVGNCGVSVVSVSEEGSVSCEGIGDVGHIPAHKQTFN